MTKYLLAIITRIIFFEVGSQIVSVFKFNYFRTLFIGSIIWGFSWARIIILSSSLLSLVVIKSIHENEPSSILKKQFYGSFSNKDLAIPLYITGHIRLILGFLKYNLRISLYKILWIFIFQTTRKYFYSEPEGVEKTMYLSLKIFFAYLSGVYFMHYLEMSLLKIFREKIFSTIKHELILREIYYTDLEYSKKEILFVIASSIFSQIILSHGLSVKENYFGSKIALALFFIEIFELLGAIIFMILGGELRDLDINKKNIREKEILDTLERKTPLFPLLNLQEKLNVSNIFLTNNNKNIMKNMHIINTVLLTEQTLLLFNMGEGEAYSFEKAYNFTFAKVREMKQK